MAATPLFPFDVWTSQITQASIPANNNSLRSQVLMSPAIAKLSTPPGSPAEDDLYIVDSSPTGAWSTFTPNNAAIYKGGSWLEFETFTGWVKTIGADVNVFNGTSWMVFAVGPSSEPWTHIYLGSDFSNNTVTYSDITSMSFPADANSTYMVECFGAYQAAATTTGLGIKTLGPTGSEYIGKIEAFSSATATLGAAQISDVTPTTVTTGVPTANTNTPVEGKFLVRTAGTSGDIKLQMRSEVASSAVTLKANLFYMSYRKLP